MFQISQLRCFVCVANELHFGRAARLLNMTQPPLTRQIQMLERELGVQLLDRASGKVRLTLAGRTFLKDAQDILRRSEASLAAARRAARADVGSVSVGFIPATSYALLPRLIQIAREQLPDVRLQLREMQTPDQIESIGARTLDLGIVRPFAPSGVVTSCCLVREPFVVAVPPRHPFARRQSLTLPMLDGQPFVEYCPTESPYLHEITIGRLRAEGVRPDTVHALSHTHSILALVEAGMGCALVPLSATGLRKSGIVYRPIVCSPALDVEMRLVWRPSEGNEVANTLREVLLTALEAP